MASQAQAQSKYFNLHVSGIGYLSRVRWVDNNSRSGGRRSEPFLSCAINALRGSPDDPRYCRPGTSLINPDGRTPAGVAPVPMWSSP
ncbi:hypothetical protein GCM10007320_65790 [Pseudorhodoferax aquiterrae]|uniref:Uncharacterized protein n=1 Tax=Pseudorhodoferax aquiterrae TaxID=747304 RepID=A0ABQ3GHN4_9BURK|nr:hypothetical protein GCM10007320_65790 [Pseudorhodoferax aquiterrae]